MKVKVGDKVYPCKSRRDVMTVNKIERVLYNGRMTTFVDLVYNKDIVRRPLRSLIPVDKPASDANI